MSLPTKTQRDELKRAKRMRSPTGCRLFVGESYVSIRKGDAGLGGVEIRPDGDIWSVDMLDSARVDMRPKAFLKDAIKLAFENVCPRKVSR